MGRYKTIKTEADIDLYDYADDFIDLILDDDELLEEMRSKIHKKCFGLSAKGLSVIDKPKNIEVIVPEKVISLNKAETYLHKCLKTGPDRFYLNLNTLFLKDEEITGIISTDGHFLLATCFQSDVKDFVKNLNNFKKHHIRCLINAYPCQLESNLFFADGKLLNHLKINNFTIEPELIDESSFEAVDLENLINKYDLNTGEDIDLSTISKDQDGDMKIKDGFFKGIFTEEIKELFNKQPAKLIYKHSVDPMVIFDERNLLILMPKRK